MKRSPNWFWESTLKLNMASRHMFTKPMVLDSIMLGTRNHAVGLKTSNGESTSIVLMDLAMKIGN